MSWVDCVVDSDYEIFSEFPYPIRRKGSDKIISERIGKDDYIKCYLNNKSYLKHRVVALQFIENDDPEHKTQIDHRDHNRANNNILNLRWVSQQDNLKNKTGYRHKYTFLENLPESAQSLDSYNGHDLDGVFVDYELKKVYLFNGLKYREIVPCRHIGNMYYRVQDIEDIQIRLSHKILFG